MNVLFSIHLFPPQHYAGAEMMALDIIKFLISKGNRVKVLIHYSNEKPYIYEGIECYGRHYQSQEELFKWADCVFTHLDPTALTVTICKRFNRPLFFIAHNDIPYTCLSGRVAIIYNSNWIAEKTKYDFPSFVLHPPCDSTKFKPSDKPGQYITLVNLNQAKGANEFYGMVRKAPRRKFLAVKGAYGTQIIPRHFDNLTIWNQQQDMMKVFDQSRILIMPSKYESWGRVAREAICCGIPVICSKTPGLMENLGGAGIYINEPLRVRSWLNVIDSLDDPSEYQKQREAVLNHAIETATEKEWESFYNFIQNFI